MRDLPDWGKFTGSITLDTLCDRIGNKKFYRSPYVFGRVLELLEQWNIDIKEVLKAGLTHQKLIFFPDLRTYDSNRNPSIHWSGLGVLRLSSGGVSSENLENRAKTLSMETIIYLDENMLVYKSKFEALMTNHNNDVLFPWMCIILERLPDDILYSDSLIHLLTYLTCLGLMQNNWFVHFRNIELLHKKLVAEIPRFIQLLQSYDVRKMLRIHLPAGNKARWTSTEMEVMDNVLTLNC
ncbi:unnamed protein product [Mytilus edulis]|uniref:Uncharacterized protein n=1 Tax=Mytilus edulis TaxID=6550 RepID=A0A8S3QVC3_MYTED|nr:unnamed protein product [Mytilus edulis]